MTRDEIPHLVGLIVGILYLAANNGSADFQLPFAIFWGFVAFGVTALLMNLADFRR